MFQIPIRVRQIASPAPAIGRQAPRALPGFAAGPAPFIIAGRDSSHSAREGRA